MKQPANAPKRPTLTKRPPPSPRLQAWRLLAAVLDARQTLDAAADAHPLTGTAADIAFTRALVRTVLRHVGQIDAVLTAYLDTPLPPKRAAVTQALRLGVAQLLLLDTPAHAAVGETVALLKTGKDAGFAGLVNAVLQRIAAERPALPDARANLPLGFKHHWKEHYGAETVREICEMAASRPPLDVWEVAAPDQELTHHRYPHPHPAVESLPGYAEGAFFVQDLAASYPARLLGNVAGEQVLDVCAAPGGKAMQLALAGATVTALDRSATRINRLRENRARLHLPITDIVADAFDWTPDAPFDAVLLDAPCSATGTWRRHPEVVHLVDAAAIAELADLQRALLARAWGWVKPGGRLVYCVCSLEREEGEAQAAWFNATMADAAPLAIPAGAGIPAICLTPQGWLRTLPSHAAETGGMDGFFAAGWRRTN